MNRKRAEQTRLISGERCHPTKNCFFKQEYEGDATSKTASVSIRRLRQWSSHIPGLKKINANTDERPLSRYCTEVLYKMHPNWTIWASLISPSSSSSVAANSVYTPPPGTASFLLAPILCVQLFCSSFFITILGAGLSSSTNNSPDAADHRSSAYIQSPSSGPALFQRALVSTLATALDFVLSFHVGAYWRLLEQRYPD